MANFHELMAQLHAEYPEEWARGKACRLLDSPGNCEFPF